MRPFATKRNPRREGKGTRRLQHPDAASALYRRLSAFLRVLFRDFSQRIHVTCGSVGQVGQHLRPQRLEDRAVIPNNEPFISNIRGRKIMNCPSQVILLRSLHKTRCGKRVSFSLSPDAPNWPQLAGPLVVCFLGLSASG